VNSRGRNCDQSHYLCAGFTEVFGRKITEYINRQVWKKNAIKVSRIYIGREQSDLEFSSFSNWKPVKVNKS